jgi:hypothetical protein
MHVMPVTVGDLGLKLGWRAMPWTSTHWDWVQSLRGAARGFSLCCPPKLSATDGRIAAIRKALLVLYPSGSVSLSDK